MEYYSPRALAIANCDVPADEPMMAPLDAQVAVDIHKHHQPPCARLAVATLVTEQTQEYLDSRSGNVVQLRPPERT